MADIRKLAPLILKWEGKFVDDPADAGGPTHMGVTLKRLIEAEFDKNKDSLVNLADLKALNEHDVIYCFLKPYYWDRWQADHIRNQSVANLLVDWVWMSGKAGINIPQAVLGVKVDGIIGEKTIQAVNQHANQQLLFEQLKNERKSFIERICKARPANMRFREGWLNRLADFRFVCVLLLFTVSFSWGGCKSTSQLELSTAMQEESTGNKVYNQHEEVLSEIQRENSTQTSWEEIVVITSDSLPAAFTALLNKPASLAKGIYILKKKQLVATNHHQKQAIEIQTKSATVETSAKREENKNATSSVKSSPKNRKLILFLIAFILLLIFFIAYRRTPFFRK